MNFRTNCSFHERDRWISLIRRHSEPACNCSDDVNATLCELCRQSFEWIDIHTKPTVTRFLDGEPESDDGQCVRVTSSGGWAGYPCNETLKSVCKRGKFWNPTHKLCWLTCENNDAVTVCLDGWFFCYSCIPCLSMFHTRMLQRSKWKPLSNLVTHITKMKLQCL